MKGHTHAFRTYCSKEQVLPPQNGATAEQEVPVTLLWVLVYLAQHFDKKREHVKALEYIEEVMIRLSVLNA
jgi:hypothetical protein